MAPIQVLVNMNFQVRLQDKLTALLAEKPLWLPGSVQGCLSYLCYRTGLWEIHFI